MSNLVSTGGRGPRFAAIRSRSGPWLREARYVLDSVDSMNLWLSYLAIMVHPRTLRTGQGVSSIMRSVERTRTEMSKQDSKKCMYRVGPIVAVLWNLAFIRCRMEMLCSHAGAWLLRIWCSSYLVWIVMNHYAVSNSST